MVHSLTIPKTTRAAVLRELGRPLTIEVLEIPQLKRGQVLVEVAFAGLCHTQVSQAKGLRGNDPYLPHLLGHEGSGRVLATGEGVERVRTGDVVVLSWIKSRGLEAPGPIYCAQDGSPVNAGPIAVFSQYAIVSESCVTKLDSGISLSCAALMGCAIPTGVGMVEHQLKPQPGQTVGVFGVGGIGLSAVMALVNAGCSQIVAIDVDPKKLDLALQLGATEGWLWGTRNIQNEFDVAIEASGKAEVIEAAFIALKKHGKLMISGNPPSGTRVSFDPFGFIFGKIVLGSAGGSCHMEEAVPSFCSRYREGKLPLEKMISKTYSLDEINIALDALHRGEVVGRVLISFSE